MKGNLQKQMLCVQVFVHKDQTGILITFLNTCSTTVLEATVALTSISITPTFQIWRIFHANEKVCHHRSKLITFWSFTPRFLTSSYVLTV